LGEVTGLVTNNKAKAKSTASAKTLKGKDKDVSKPKFDGIVLKDKASSDAPHRRTATGPVTRRTTRRTAVAQPPPQQLDDVKEVPEVVDVHDDDAMIVDPPAVPVPAPTLIPQIQKRKSATQIESVTVIATRQSEAHPQTFPRVFIPLQQTDDAESNRVFKKRRTSSEPPPDALEEHQLQDEPAVDEPQYVDAEPEADPDGDQWEDLDAEDEDDPLMASEYVGEIFNYLKDVEVRFCPYDQCCFHNFFLPQQTTMPNPSYMENQHDLAWKMRGILTDWLIQVHVRFHLLPETLYLCVNIIDRFLSVRVVSLAKLQLVGITCMFIAAKFEEIVSPSVTHFLYCADASYTEAEILQAERYVLKTLDWNLSYPNPVHYLRRVSKADDYDVKVRTVAKYLLEIGCLEWRLIAAPPSLMAAAAIWLARLVLGREVWVHFTPQLVARILRRLSFMQTPNLAHYSSYAESALIPTANLMLNYILKPIRHESFYKKYAGKRYFKVRFRSMLSFSLIPLTYPSL
jgi:hypothetical protein